MGLLYYFYYTLLLLSVGVCALLEEERMPYPTPNMSSTSVPAIAAGYYIIKREAPWHAGIYKKTTNPYIQICGGTVIAKNAVITAAHCFTQDRHIPPASEYAVAAGKIYRPWNDPHDEGAQKSDVKEIRIPPRYQGSVANFQDDIAVVIIIMEFQFGYYVRPACISFNGDFDEAQLQDGLFGKVVGWGLKGENSSPSQVLQGATLPTITINKCIEQSPVSFRSSITGDKICAGYNNGTAVCRGDSGGGLVYETAVNHYYDHVFLRGVVSTSPTSQNSCNVYTWATFTHLLKHEHFLKSVLPDIELSCMLKSSELKIEFRFGGTTQIEQRFDDEKCTCVCPNKP